MIMNYDFNEYILVAKYPTRFPFFCFQRCYIGFTMKKDEKRVKVIGLKPGVAAVKSYNKKGKLSYEWVVLVKK